MPPYPYIRSRCDSNIEVGSPQKTRWVLLVLDCALKKGQSSLVRLSWNCLNKWLSHRVVESALQRIRSAGLGRLLFVELWSRTRGNYHRLSSWITSIPFLSTTTVTWRASFWYFKIHRDRCRSLRDSLLPSCRSHRCSEVDREIREFANFQDWSWLDVRSQWRPESTVNQQRSVPFSTQVSKWVRKPESLRLVSNWSAPRLQCPYRVARAHEFVHQCWSLPWKSVTINDCLAKVKKL